MVEFVGPFESHAVVVDGRRVPLLHSHPHADGSVQLVLDHRFGLEVAAEDVQQTVWFLAHAIAVALGYSCHPSESTEPALNSPFTRMVGIQINPPTLAVVPDPAPSDGSKPR